MGAAPVLGGAADGATDVIMADGEGGAGEAGALCAGGAIEEDGGGTSDGCAGAAGVAEALGDTAGSSDGWGCSDADGAFPVKMMRPSPPSARLEALEV